MINLLGNVFLDFTAGGCKPTDNVINLVGTASNDAVPTDPFFAMGGFECFLNIAAIEGSGRTVLIADQNTFALLVAKTMSSSFHGATVDEISRYIRLAIATHKYEHARRNTADKNVVDTLLNLTLPSKSDLSRLISPVMCDKLDIRHLNQIQPIEFLLSSVLLKDYTCEYSNYNLLNRLDTVIWKIIAWDFVEFRRDLLYGMYNLNKFFGINIDMESDTLAEDIAEYVDHPLFSHDNNPSNIEYIKTHYGEIRALIDKVSQLNGANDVTYDRYIKIDPTKGLTVDDVIEMVKLDSKMHCSQLFGRTEYRSNTNNMFISMLYAGDKSKYANLYLEN